MYHDALTGLPNRALLLDRLGQQLAQASRYDRMLAVLSLDLDRFAWINDTLGRERGDALLTEVAARLTACTRAGDTVARLGADEFAICLPEIARREDAAIVARKVFAALAEPFDLAGAAITIGARIGISICPRDGLDAETILQHAAMALHGADRRAKNTYTFFAKAG